MDDVDFEKQEQALLARAAKFRGLTSKPGNKFKVVNYLVDIYSDGIRMSGTVWKPENTRPDEKLPAILLCHGWGGKRAHLDFSYATKFAQAGFIVLTFDYRGWGDSDGVLVPAEKHTNNAGVVDMKVRVVRKVIDPEWQLRDVNSALNFFMSVPNVDTSRIGIWGSSFGGGHALAMGAQDDRIKCIVCQIGSINTHSNWVNRHPQYRGVAAIQNLAIDQAQGKVFPWTIQNPVGLDGSPNLPKVVFEHTTNTLASIDKIRAPTLILAAEKEELFKNEHNSEYVYEKLKGKVPVEIGYLAGGHYDAYSQPAYGQGVAKALEWFQVYLGSPVAKL
eukprot:CAMPEP_0203749824 /NCGR_PEP_ID=MMETSP0098-20131031/4228_1 /ASSEMBLY_ACC=CAM_ASM_000208 /TAXON_ID=96639 /ORGANISM=" , Strain NY0313808BC1" /LENGTH=332 /DNA_ID=CAMNT_0050638935 /DNA_START=179 /DNA_END=1177 /DNA_ORIENTATION=+